MSKAESLNPSINLETLQEVGKEKKTSSDNSPQTKQETEIESPNDPKMSPTLEGIETSTGVDETNLNRTCTDLHALNEPIDQERKVNELTSSSPPPSYDFVLEETGLKKQERLLSPSTPPKAQEIMHKSSKEFYKAVAKQLGITCKMSDHCRCYDCQSHYFDCEYEQNEQEKTDGGLGAGTPVFLHEVMHGSACNIL